MHDKVYGSGDAADDVVNELIFVRWIELTVEFDHVLADVAD